MKNDPVDYVILINWLVLFIPNDTDTIIIIVDITVECEYHK